MYTIQYFYNKFLAKIDKEGSDLYSVEVVMEFLTTATYDFIEETVKYLANTQQLRDFLMPLYTPYEIVLAVNPTNSKEMLGSLPNDYLNLETIQITDSLATVRRTKLYRTGAMDANINNPNKKPTAEYPSVILYQNYIASYGSSNQTKANGFYIVKPTFGDHEGVLTTEIAVNLPDNTVEKIMNLMVSMIHAKEGDGRYQLAYNQEQSFGKTNK